MSTAVVDLTNGIIKWYTVVAAGAATLGWAAKLDTAFTTVNNLGTGEDLGIGVFLESAVAGARVRVLIPHPIVRVVVGTGGATISTKATWVADGFTDAPAHDSSGGTDNVIYGVFMETGVVTNRIGMQFFMGNRGSA